MLGLTGVAERSVVLVTSGLDLDARDISGGLIHRVELRVGILDSDLEPFPRRSDRPRDAREGT